MSAHRTRQLLEFGDPWRERFQQFLYLGHTPNGHPEPVDWIARRPLKSHHLCSYALRRKGLVYRSKIDARVNVDVLACGVDRRPPQERLRDIRLRLVWRRFAARLLRLVGAADTLDARSSGN